jgi:hypothetical protein
MSDPLSIAAGVGGLIALTLTVIKLNKEYVDSVKHAPKVIAQYHQELLMLQSSLALLQKRLSDAEIRHYLVRKEQQAPDMLQDASNGIDGCSTALQKMLSRITKKDKTPSVITRMTFYFDESEIEKDLHRLQRYRSMLMDNFNHALSVAHAHHLQHLVVTAAEVDQLSQTIFQDLHLLGECVNRMEVTSNETLGTVKITRQDVAKFKMVWSAWSRVDWI